METEDCSKEILFERLSDLEKIRLGLFNLHRKIFLGICAVISLIFGCFALSFVILALVFHWFILMLLGLLFVVLQLCVMYIFEKKDSKWSIIELAFLLQHQPKLKRSKK